MKIGVIDFFIKNKEELVQEEYNRTRLLVIVLLTLISISSSLFLLSFFGMFTGLVNLMISIILVLNLLFLRYKGNLDITFFITMVLCTAFMSFNIVKNGYILSPDNKWLVIALITIFFMKPKWLTPYAVFLLFFQTWLLYQSYILELGNKIFEEYIDSILFFGLSYGMLILLNRYQVLQNQRILEINQLLEERTDQLLESNQELEKFAFVVSHDLKSPLKNIISFTKLLERALKKSKMDSVFEYTDFIKNGALQLNQLISDVLNYSRLDTITKTDDEVNLNIIVDEIRTSISRHVKERNAKILVKNELPVVYSQKTVMIQLLKNFIENGIKYNESEMPTVTLEYQFDDNQNKLIISDNGIGIKEEFQHTIFKMFTRLHSKSEYEGTGIGLSICRKIMNKLGGTIDVSSEESRGTSFTLSFPREFVVGNGMGLVKRAI